MKSVYNLVSRMTGLLSKLVVGMLIISATAFAQEVDKTQPYEMIQIVADNTFSRLKAEKDQIRQQPELLKGVVSDELMPYVNHKYAALKLLGPNLKGAKKKDVQAFIDAFQKYLVTSYAQVLTLYTDQTIEMKPERKIKDGKRITSVKVDVIDAPRPNIEIEFKLRKNSKTGEWLAFDMVAEGVSLLSSKQSEWSGKIRKEGIASVSKNLLKLSENPIRFEGEEK